VSSPGVSGTNGEDFTALDAAGLVLLQVKHKEAEPKTFLSHVLHLLNELEGSIADVGPGAGVTGSADADVKVTFMSVFDVVKNVSEFPTVSCTLIELGRLNSRGSTPTTFCSALSLAAGSIFDILDWSHEDSGMLDEITAWCGKEGERLADMSLAEFHMSLGDRGGE
jgi:hypothetical protein